MLAKNRNLQTEKVLMIDVGSFSTKIGYAGESEPQLIERTAIAKDSNGQIICGRDATTKGNFEVPIKHDKILDFEKWT